MKIHIVQKGDTLWKIAQKYGVDFNQLKSMNTHLANPDAIMPGMKIKVPTNAGTIKKEAPMKEKAVKEKPIYEHPFAETKPFVELVEDTKPVKEQPIAKKVQPKKEKPKKMFVPKPPKPVIPEIDINNYYMLNMAKMNIEQPKPVKEQPVKEQPIVEVPKIEIPEIPEVKEEKVEEAPLVQEELPAQPKVQPQVFVQPIYPCQPCVPMTPVLPGSGLPYFPCPQPYYPQMPVMYPHYPLMPGMNQQYFMQPAQGSYLAMQPQQGVAGLEQPSGYTMQPGNQTQEALTQQLTEADFDHDYANDDYSSTMPVTPVQGVNDLSMAQGYSPYQPMIEYPTYQQPYYPATSPTSDCGCGGQSTPMTYSTMPSYQAMPYQGAPTDGYGSYPYNYGMMPAGNYSAQSVPSMWGGGQPHYPFPMNKMRLENQQEVDEDEKSEY